MSEKWYPGKPETELEYYKRKCNELQLENNILKKKNSDYSWQTNPDRSGGAFTQWEIDNANKW